MTTADSSPLFIGLMSGTSMDAVDAILAQFSSEGEYQTTLGWHCQDIPVNLRKNLATLCSPGINEIDLMGQVDHQLGEIFAAAALTLLRKCAVAPGRITAIGSHGQTIRHRPLIVGNIHPFSLQIGDPNFIAARTGITTVADFRRADIAAGGQGAPLAPNFHKHVFHDAKKNRVIVNIGGMANLTWLPTEGQVTGFDTGPGNRLMDHWTQKNLNLQFDSEGQWAAQYTANESLLKRFKSHPFFAEQAPKSTGREAFNEFWLDAQLTNVDPPLNPGNVQATLAKLTVVSVADAIGGLPGPIDEVYICGGGALNKTLMEHLQFALAPATVATTAVLGVDPKQVEALAFAWLAQRTLRGQPGNLPAATGAKYEAILGGIYYPPPQKI